MKLLTYIKTKTGLKNILILLILGLFFTIYESIIFYLNLVPKVKKKLLNSIDYLDFLFNDEQKKNISYLYNYENNKNNKNNKNDEPLLLDIFRVFKNRENNIISINNNYTFLLVIILIVILLILIIFITFYVPIDRDVVVKSGIIILLIMIFQYLFYIFGMEYKYIDSESNNELKYFAIKNM